MNPKLIDTPSNTILMDKFKNDEFMVEFLGFYDVLSNHYHNKIFTLLFRY